MFKVHPGDKFGMLTVISSNGQKTQVTRSWWCQCGCGVKKMISETRLKRGSCSSCGCRRFELMNEEAVTIPTNRMITTGMKFGKYTVTAKKGRDLKLNPVWECKCICGRIIVATEWQLRLGKTKKCACGLAGKRDKYAGANQAI